MLDSGIGNKHGKLAALHKIGQQQSVFRPESANIKKTGLDVCFRSSDGEPGSVQVSDATVWLKHLILKAYESQFFRPAEQC